MTHPPYYVFTASLFTPKSTHKLAKGCSQDFTFRGVERQGGGGGGEGEMGTRLKTHRSNVKYSETTPVMLSAPIEPAVEYLSSLSMCTASATDVGDLIFTTPLVSPPPLLLLLRAASISSSSSITEFPGDMQVALAMQSRKGLLRWWVGVISSASLQQW